MINNERWVREALEEARKARADELDKWAKSIVSLAKKADQCSAYDLARTLRFIAMKLRKARDGWRKSPPVYEDKSLKDAVSIFEPYRPAKKGKS